MSNEMSLLSEAFGYGLNDLQWFTVNAMKSAFIPFDERLPIINEQIKPQYTALRAVLAERMTGGVGNGAA
jgi:adenosine deaminase